jgi:hypothetical protein
MNNKETNAATTRFRTPELGVAAFLVSTKQLSLIDADVEPSGHAIFVFDDPTGIGRQLETSFITGGALAPAAEFHRQLRVLRRLIENRRLLLPSHTERTQRFNDYEFTARR